ncbi:uncharacterized protein N0V89_002046 [Didymosphaeria variabile]|uniref:Uncharacterized protein n=1 Tax=Didymosphaeria variabile TaxID=1932322 RepID=A0A9W9CE08_9PLEO|nr:uncharacterized protein N0V89_002046 [Didymosphaeria variabile]KAJ4357470.1 hypothetical protein N0V89_002046 [Didymosphaeria variabile]
MARCRGSSRRAPPPRSPKKRVTRSMNSIDKSHQYDTDGMPSKRRADEDAAPEQSRANKVHIDSASTAHDAATHKQLRQAKTAENEADVAKAERDQNGAPVTKSVSVQTVSDYEHNVRLNATISLLAGTGSTVARLPRTTKAPLVAKRQDAITRRAHSKRDDPRNGYLTGEPSWKDLPPAPFEAHEMRRAENYKRENARFNQVHDRVLSRSMSQNKKLASDWENSKLVSGPTQKSNGQTGREASRTAATVENARDQQPLKGEGRELSLSPVFRIANPKPEYEFDPLDLDASRVWPIGDSVPSRHRPPADYSFLDFPEPRVGSSPLPHVPFPEPLLPANKPQSERTRTPRDLEGERPQTLRERYLSRHNHFASNKEAEMTQKQMEAYVDFDAKL